MLKEGWDVKNVYVIASMRASVSEVMTEQTIGRGMRLPFGQYTGTELLDTLEVLAHEKYSELLEKRKVLNEAFINYGTYAEIRHLADGSTVVRQKTVSSDAEVLGGFAAAPGGVAAGGVVRDAADMTFGSTPGTTAPIVDETLLLGDGREGSASTTPAGGGAVVDVETRTRQAQEAAEKTSTVARYAPLPEREPILVPRLVSILQNADVSLNQITDYEPFERLGRTLTADITEELIRTKIVTSHDGRTAKANTETASDKLMSAFPLVIPLSASREALIHRVMGVKGVPNRQLEIGAARRIVDHLIGAMGEKAADHLSAFIERCGQRLGAEVSKTLREVNSAQVTYSDDVELVPLDKIREARKRQVAGHADGSFDKSVAFNGWSKNLYSHAWFDTSPEFKAANAIDNGKNVIVWARLHINDIPITWTSQGRQYNPDFVVIEEGDGKRYGWLVETKADRDMTSAEVAAKRKAAKQWANTANSSPAVDITWSYLLLGELDVTDAQGSWEFMKGFGQ